MIGLLQLYEMFRELSKAELERLRLQFALEYNQ